MYNHQHKCVLFLFITMSLLNATSQTSLAQTRTPADLYSQTSEMANLMIQYDADRASIMRFYATSGTGDEWWLRQARSDYNSPERRQRLLQLNADYTRQ